MPSRPRARPGGAGNHRARPATRRTSPSPPRGGPLARWPSRSRGTDVALAVGTGGGKCKEGCGEVPAVRKGKGGGVDAREGGGGGVEPRSSGNFAAGRGTREVAPSLASGVTSVRRVQSLMPLLRYLFNRQAHKHEWVLRRAQTESGRGYPCNWPCLAPAATTGGPWSDQGAHRVAKAGCWRARRIRTMTRRFDACVSSRSRGMADAGQGHIGATCAPWIAELVAAASLGRGFTAVAPGQWRRTTSGP